MSLSLCRTVFEDGERRPDGSSMPLTLRCAMSDDYDVFDKGEIVGRAYFGNQTLLTSAQRTTPTR
jgi:hypothetical protein